MKFIEEHESSHIWLIIIQIWKDKYPTIEFQDNHVISHTLVSISGISGASNGLQGDHTLSI